MMSYIFTFFIGFIAGGVLMGYYFLNKEGY